MSAEAVKKRGRPKKVISDPIEIDLPESKKSTTRAKSTKAALKPTKPATIATKNAPKPATPSKPTTPPAKTAPKPPAPPSPPSAKSETKSPAPPSKPASKPPVTPETSKILGQVRELASKTVPAAAKPSKSSKPSPTTISSDASAQSSTSASEPPKPLSTNISPKIPAQIPAKQTQVPPATSKPPKIPIAQLNSEIVSSISSRAGARPNAGGSEKLPPNYKPVARKVTMAIVALPILIVTSYVLYERLVIGEDRKVLVNPGLTKVEVPEDNPKSESSS